MDKEAVEFLDSAYGEPREHLPVWKTYCNKCPSRYAKTHGINDPEAEMIRNSGFEIRRRMLFVCAWRQKKTCKGIYEKLISDFESSAQEGK